MSDVKKAKQHSGFIQIPYEFFQESEGRFSGRVETLLRGVIYGFSLGSSSCRFSYTAFEEYINRSRATVARAVRDLRDRSNDVKITRQGGKASEYQYVGEVERKRKHVRVPIFLFFTKVKMPKGKSGEFEFRYLTGTEIFVYSLFSTHCLKDEGKGEFEGSEISIANILHCSQRSVDRAILALMKAKMISRLKKGINRRDAKSTYHVNLKFYNKLWKKHNPIEKKGEKSSSTVPPKFIAPQDVNANARADRERYYTLIRNEAEAKVDRALARAKSVPGFDDVYKQRRVLDIALVKAESKNPDKLPALKEQERTLTFEYDRLLRSVGLTAEDLIPQYRCSQCSDTGYQKDGRMCTCYAPPPKGAL